MVCGVSVGPAKFGGTNGPGSQKESHPPSESESIKISLISQEKANQDMNHILPYSFTPLSEPLTFMPRDMHMHAHARLWLAHDSRTGNYPHLSAAFDKSSLLET